MYCFWQILVTFEHLLLQLQCTCKQEKIISTACAEGWQLTHPSVYQCLHTSPSALTLVSERLCLAHRLCTGLGRNIPELLSVSLRGHCCLLHLYASLHFIPSELVPPGNREHLHDDVFQAHLAKPLPEQPASSGSGLWSRKENLAFALPWSYLLEFPMTLSSKGPNSS